MLRKIKQKEVVVRDGIPVPEEFKEIIKPGTKVLIRAEKFGIIIRPKIDPIKDMVGILSTKKRINVEKELDERFEYAKEIY